MTIIEDQPTTETGALLERLQLRADVTDFLEAEAMLLDRNRLREWLADCLDDEVDYFVPVRTTGDEDDPTVEELGHLDETLASLQYRVDSLLATTTFAGKPPSRTRRLVTNIRVVGVERDQIEVESYLALFRNRFNETKYDILTAERRDVLRRSPDGLRLRRRTVILDESTLGIDNLAIIF